MVTLEDYVPVSVWSRGWARWVWYVFLLVLGTWVVYYGVKLARYSFLIVNDIYIAWHIIFGSGKHSTQKHLRLHPYFCETHQLDEATVREIYYFVLDMIDSENSVVNDLHRVLLRYSHILLCREKIDGSLRGIALVGIERKGAYTLMKTGMFVFQHQYRGSPFIYIIGAYLALKELILHPLTPVYNISKGFTYKSYMIASNFSEFYPAYNKETPGHFKKIFAEYAETVKTPNETFNPETFVLEREFSAVKEHAAMISEEDMKNPHIRFFVERNPGWRKGHCMLQVFRLSWMDMLRLVRLISQRSKKHGPSSSLAKDLVKKSRKLSKPPPSIHKRVTFIDPLANKYALELYEVDCFGEASQDEGSEGTPRLRLPSFERRDSTETDLNVCMDIPM